VAEHDPARLSDQAAGGRPQAHLVAGAADQQLRQARRPAPQQQLQSPVPAGQHDLRLQRDVPGAADQRRVRSRRAGPLREPPRQGQRLRPPGLRGAELLVPDPPPQRPHGPGVGRPAPLRSPSLRPLRALHARGGLRARGVGGPDVPGLPGRRRRLREAVVLLVPRPRARPHGRQRVQGHGRPDAAV
jgi:hypothetical protein